MLRARLLASERIDLLLDVGANEGQYALRMRRAGFQGRIVSFEPLSDAFAALERRAAATRAGRLAGWRCPTPTARPRSTSRATRPRARC